ncbi:MAG: hypothetical protein H7834_05495 [Magnetococcus sp. YQC-9]
MSSGDLPLRVAVPMFQRLEVLPSSAVLEEESLSGCMEVWTGESTRRSDAVQDVMSSCHIRLPNGAALELNGTGSTGLIGHLLQVAGAFPVKAGNLPR